MFKISNNDFRILIKYKEFLKYLDGILENIPRKDMYYKDKIKDISILLLEDIFKCSYDNKKDNINRYFTNIKSQIALLDFMLERLLDKKYISEKSLYKIGTMLTEINKMATGWLNNMVNNASKY